MSPATVAVIQFPGVNCEAESLRALARVGLEAELFRWTRPASELRGFQAYVLPGGFSFRTGDCPTINVDSYGNVRFWL